MRINVTYDVFKVSLETKKHNTSLFNSRSRRANTVLITLMAHMPYWWYRQDSVY